MARVPFCGSCSDSCELYVMGEASLSLLSLSSVRKCPASKQGIARGCKGIPWVVLQRVADEIENTEEPLVHSSSYSIGQF